MKYPVSLRIGKPDVPDVYIEEFEEGKEDDLALFLELHNDPDAFGGVLRDYKQKKRRLDYVKGTGLWKFHHQLPVEPTCWLIENGFSIDEGTGTIHIEYKRVGDSTLSNKQPDYYPRAIHMLVTTYFTYHFDNHKDAVMFKLMFGGD